MELYVGGSHQGKLSYVMAKKGITEVKAFADGAACSSEEALHKGRINRLHLLLGRMDRQEAEAFITSFLSEREDGIVICDEVGMGIVPIEKQDREYRELVGRCLCRLAERATVMERIICGIGMRIK